MHIFILLPVMVVFGFLSTCLIGLQSEHIELDEDLVLAVYTKAVALSVGFIAFVMMLPGHLFVRSAVAVANIKKQQASMNDQLAICAPMGLLCGVQPVPQFAAVQHPQAARHKKHVIARLLEARVVIADKAKTLGPENRGPIFGGKLPAAV